MTDQERVEILRDHGFIGIDLPMISKLKQPDYYGIQLTDEAIRVLGAYAAPRTRMSQTDAILHYVDRMGSITSWEATNILNIMSFTKRMSEIRQMPGFIVSQKWESNGRSKWLRYFIERSEENAD